MIGSGDQTVVHAVSVRGSGWPTAAVLAGFLDTDDQTGHRHMVVSLDEPTEQLLRVYGVPIAARVGGLSRSLRSKGKSLAATLRTLGVDQDAIVQPWGADGGRVVEAARPSLGRAVAATATKHTVRPWPVAALLPEHAKRNNVNNGSASLVFCAREGTLADAANAAGQRGVTALSGYQGAAVLASYEAAAAERGLRLTRELRETWQLRFEARPMHQLFAQSDLVVVPRPSSGDTTADVIPVVALAAAIGVPAVVERFEVGATDPAEAFGISAATVFVDPTDRLAVPRAIAEVLDMLKNGQMADRIESARSDSRTFSDAAAFADALRDRWSLLKNSRGRAEASRRVFAPRDPDREGGPLALNLD